ncbi:MAG: Asp-tRNA(Asn)/Glu-tRNA(Gln) amidotransferase subunit GatB [Candidatus Limnocylindrales bacterium]
MKVEREAVIGIEIHVQLRTVSKMFCACATDIADAPPNTRTCPICLGLPGTLPVINREAVRHVLATGLALGASIPPVTRWDRKNYFYPDLPKGYQISQFDLPLASGGALSVDTSAGPVTVAIRRAHLEEDTARLVHQVGVDGRRLSLIDFNRSGMPLMEVVTEPVIPTAEAARRYAEGLRLLLLTIGASDAALENGQMRVEANVSLRPAGATSFGTRVEVKNMNSFRSVERAIDHEIRRQGAALDAGEVVVQETRGWDDGRGATYVMRIKEDSDDYRYFPEPDLPPLRTDEAWLETIRAGLPELPAARRERYRASLGLSPYDAAVLVADAGATDLFEATLAADPGLPAKRVANWVAGEYLRLGAREAAVVRPAELAALVRAVEAGQLSTTNAKEVFARHAATGQAVALIVDASGMRRISDETALREAVAGVIDENPAAAADVRAGKGQAARFLVGQVMKRTRGQADAALVQRLVKDALSPPEDG